MKLADYIKDEVDEQLEEIYEEGVKKGIEQGIGQGIDQAIETGILNGIETMKKRGFDDQTIFDIVTEQFNVSAEKVKEVISKNKAVC